MGLKNKEDQEIVDGLEGLKPTQGAYGNLVDAIINALKLSATMQGRLKEVTDELVEHSKILVCLTKILIVLTAILIVVGVIAIFWHPTF